jgi:hypothetical protein
MGISFPVNGEQHDDVGGGHMNTSFTINSNGNLYATTRIWTNVKMVGFTGCVFIAIMDEKGFAIWHTEHHRYSVDGTSIGRSDRTETWQATVPLDILSRVKSYGIIQRHTPKARILDNSYLEKLIQEIIDCHENLAINGEALPIKRTWFQEVDLTKMSLILSENKFKINGSWNFRFRENFPPLHNWMPKRGEFSKQFVIGVENGRLALREGEYQLAVVSGENQMSDFVYAYPLIQNGLETAINEFVDRRLIPTIRQELEKLDIRHIIINCIQDEVGSSIETMQQELNEFLEQGIESVSARSIEGGLIITLQ